MILQIYLFYSARIYIAFSRFWFKHFANVDPPNNLMREVQLAYPLYRKANKEVKSLAQGYPANKGQNSVQIQAVRL